MKALIRVLWLLLSLTTLAGDVVATGLGVTAEVERIPPVAIVTWNAEVGDWDVQLVPPGEAFSDSPPIPTCTCQCPAISFTFPEAQDVPTP